MFTFFPLSFSLQATPLKPSVHCEAVPAPWGWFQAAALEHEEPCCGAVIALTWYSLLQDADVFGSHCKCFSHSRFPSFIFQDYTATSHALCSEPFPAFWTVTQWWNFLGTEMALLMVLHHGRESTGINWVWLKCSQFQLGWQSYALSALFICSCFNANTRVNSNVDMMKERSFMHLQGFSKKLCVLKLNKVQQFSIKWQNEWLYFPCCIFSIR